MSPYGFHNNNWFKRRRVNSYCHDIELVSYLGPKLWDLVPNKIKEFEFASAFKFKNTMDP